MSQSSPNPATPATTRVIVGMSGGVDSSVAAALLLEQGYSVEGLFMKNWEEDDGTEYCTALEDLADAQKICATLGIRLHTANFAAEYWDNVFEEFLHEYHAGRTPNPDVLCNREIKFKQFVDYAQSLGADYIATGHYARSAMIGGEYHLLKGLDTNKDQTYFLQAVPLGQLRRCLFPLGDWQKDQVRDRAASMGLHNAQRKDSTGICFIGERRFDDFLQRYIADNPGPMIDETGRRLGEHRGLHHYTLGQRQGLKLGGIRGRPEAPWYVAMKCVSTNTLGVTQNEALLCGSWLRAVELNWLTEPELPLACSARIRYRQQDVSCTLSKAADGQLLVRFQTPQRAITPGQFVAFYVAQRMIGGARIDTTQSNFPQIFGTA